MPSTSTTSPPDSGFIPRKEFIREQRPIPNSFAILAIAGSNLIRLYSFPLSLVTALRRLFEQQRLVSACREDVVRNLYEFTLEGKPWANSTKVTSEKLLLDILAIVFQAGYTYLSTIDYGRESDDRLTLAFSRPLLQVHGSRSASPFSTASLPDGSVISEKSRARHAPFALSFPSTTKLRVVAPPLDSTPAILQAVRSSWPRGVVSEKKVGDSTFEFKLKGYKWFQEDTFASDSLQHILSLLSSLDTHCFSLLTSLSLTKGAKGKDLWIFMGLAPLSTEDSAESRTPSVVHADNKRSLHSPEPHAQGQPSSAQGHSQNRRVATESNTSPQYGQASQHTRSPTDISALHPLPPGGASNLLRKPAPRAQVPVSVHEAESDNRVDSGHRVHLPSVISDNTDNMTGVGSIGYTQDVFYSTPPFGAYDKPGRPRVPTTSAPVDAPPRLISPNRPRNSLLPVSSRTKTPPLLVSNIPSPSAHPQPPLGQVHAGTSQQIQGDVPSSGRSSEVHNLLGPGVFRDTAFSSSTEASYDIPIKWVGASREPPQIYDQSRQPKPAPGQRASSSPVLPGGWRPSPVKERVEEEPEQGDLVQEEGPTTPVHEVGSRVKTPEVNQPSEIGLRKSETALVGMMGPAFPPSSTTPKMTWSPNDKGKMKDTAPNPGGQGWVLVNVEGKASPTADMETTLSSPSSPTSPTFRDLSTSSQLRQPRDEQASMSPAAKAIVIVDAVEAKNKKNGTHSTPRRFLSLRRKKSIKAIDQASEGSDLSTDKGQSKYKSRGPFRDKLKHIGTPGAPRNDGKRRSID